MTRPSGVCLADVLGAMSLAVDLGLGQPMGHVARSCLLAGRLGSAAGIGAEQLRGLYFVTLMGWVGCIADSHAAAAAFGDDIDYRAGVYDIDMRPLPFLGYLLGRAGPEEGVFARTGRRAQLIATGARTVQDSLRAHCQVTEQVARRLGLPESVCLSLRQVFARWDGQGLPRTLAGDRLAVTIRLWHIADVAEVHYARGGASAATAVVRARRGTHFDPALADVFCAQAEQLLTPFAADPDVTWQDIADAEPALGLQLDDEELDRALAVLADWVDLKSPYFTGHSAAVAESAAVAAVAMGLPDDEIRLVRRAGLVHDLGRVGVPNTIWDKPSPLTPAERERIRLHSYYTERMLASPHALAEIGRVAGSAHERLDGSGYHRGRSAADLPRTARLLAAADCYRTSREPRPHRAPLTKGDAADALTAKAHAGELDAAACEAVLSTTARSPRRVPGPVGLTAREVEVLALLATGSTNKQIARSLGISPKTAGNHIEHVYTKAGVSTRAAATLFAMEHGLVVSPSGA